MRFQINTTDKLLLPDIFNMESQKWKSADAELLSLISEFTTWHTVWTVYQMYQATNRTTFRQEFTYAQSRWCLTWICITGMFSIGNCLVLCSFSNLLSAILQFLMPWQNPHSSLLPLVFDNSKWLCYKSCLHRWWKIIKVPTINQSTGRLSQNLCENC